ncbi:MAG TPA: aminoglycoside phosphotransferase family protein [Solirubrobacteraceae bacterium]
MPRLVDEIASDWGLELGEPYVPGGQCAWVAAARGAAGEELVLKVGWRHPEAEQEGDALEHWDGAGAVRCFKAWSFDESTVLLLERCVPGTPLGSALPEVQQDVVIAGLLRRMWARALPGRHPFRPLREMCDAWAASFERNFGADARGLDPGLARTGVALLRELPASLPAGQEVLLCTDLHAGNVLAAEREPWLVIDPKPFVGDPAYDAVQHMLNCDRRLAGDPVGLSRRMAGLLDLDLERVRLWLFARCAQEALHDEAMREAARRLGR